MPVWLSGVLLLMLAVACKKTPVPPPDAGAGKPSVRAAGPRGPGRSPPPGRVGRPRRVPTVRVVPAGELGRFGKAVVSSLNARASREAAQVLAEGGNAIDAAVTATLLVAVMEPQATTIGGGGFLVHFEAATGKVRTLDFRERAPRRAHRRMYHRNGRLRPRLARTGHLAPGVPGLLAGLEEAHRKLGRLPWARLVRPAVRAAERFRASRRLALIARRRVADLRRFRLAAHTFLPGGKPLERGQIVRRPELARTLRAVAREGARAFYRGTIAQKIAAEMRRGGGVIDEEDLRRYRPVWREPVRGRYRDVELVSMPLPSSGGLLLVQMLHMLAKDDLRSLDAGTRAHLVTEVMRRAFADRAEFLGDADFVKNIPLRGLLDPGYARRRRAGIDPARASGSKRVGAGRPPKRESENTSHLSIIDAEGNAVSLTHSTNYLFGSCVIVPGTGVLLNNTMDDFALVPGQPNVYGLVGKEANAIAPGKTPLSSMTPTLILRGNKPWLVLGSPGGSRIISTVLHVLLNRVVLGMDLAAAVKAPRWHHQWLPDRVMVERSGAHTRWAQALRSRGHRLEVVPFFGNANSAELTPAGLRLGVADPRRHGGAAGY